MMSDKSEAAFRTISEVAETIGVPQHVLRFWETKFTSLKPMKRGGNRRYYRPEDVELLRNINRLLYSDGYTIKGVQKLLREKGANALAPGAPRNAASPDPAPPASLFSVVMKPGGGGMDAAFIASLQGIRDRLTGALAEAKAA